MSSARAISILGTASHSGKSVLTAGLCRLLTRRGIRVAPFKAQNMALNSAVTSEGLEIGRAQFAQALACGLEPEVNMNPVLLKPTGERRIQVVLWGKVWGVLTGRQYYRHKDFFFEQVLDGYRRLASRFDVILLEGAGSPVEMNLLDRDIVNMPLAEAVDARCILIADIDRGGVFATLSGTRNLLSEQNRERFLGFVINKFRGDPELFTDGLQILEQLTEWPCLGVVPHLDWLLLDEEDSVALTDKRARVSHPSRLTVVVVSLPHMANYTDFDPLEAANLNFRYSRSPTHLEEADLIILPGTKNTISDLKWLKHSGLAEQIRRRAAEGSQVLGICGGYQMLGQMILDPFGVEGDHAEEAGLGLLPVVTHMNETKATFPVKARYEEAAIALEAYEIHMGSTQPEEPRASLQPVFQITRLDDGEARPDGCRLKNVQGTYLHGIFDNPEFCRVYLSHIAFRMGRDFEWEGILDKDTVLDRWADLLEDRLEMDLIESGWR